MSLNPHRRLVTLGGLGNMLPLRLNNASGRAILNPRFFGTFCFGKINRFQLDTLHLLKFLPPYIRLHMLASLFEYIKSLPLSYRRLLDGLEQVASDQEIGKHSAPNLGFLSLPTVVSTKHGEHMDGSYPPENRSSSNAQVQLTAPSMRRRLLDVKLLDAPPPCFC